MTTRNLWVVERWVVGRCVGKVGKVWRPTSSARLTRKEARKEKAWLGRNFPQHPAYFRLWKYQAVTPKKRGVA